MKFVPKKFYILLLAGLLAGLVLGCDSDDDSEPAPEPAPEPPSFGELGGVVVAEGEAVQIRSMISHTGWGDQGEFGNANRNAIELAVADFGDIHGREVALGWRINEMCSPEGGRAGAQQVIADSQVVGVIGTSCSGAGAAALALLSEAGLVMISPSNTSPSLTSDLAGNAASNNRPGYFRISNNDLFTGRAVADFAYNELDLRQMGTVDAYDADGNPDAYIVGLVKAFSDAFTALGGEVVATYRIADDQTDMTDALGTLAAAEPEGVFFPLYAIEAKSFVEQARAHADLKETDLLLIAADAVFTTEFLRTPESEGLYMAGPVANFGPDNVNAVTGQNEDAVREAARTLYGDPLKVNFWQHAYDATTLLLDAIEAVAVQQDGKLYIDRAALREQIGATDGLQGITGVISCDAFGDCGTGRTDIFHHTDSSVTDSSQLPVVHQFAP